LKSICKPEWQWIMPLTFYRTTGNHSTIAAKTFSDHLHRILCLCWWLSCFPIRKAFHAFFTFFPDRDHSWVLHSEDATGSVVILPAVQIFL